MTALLWWLAIAAFVTCAALVMGQPASGNARHAERAVGAVVIVAAIAAGWLGISALLQSSVLAPCPYSSNAKLFHGCPPDGSFRQVSVASTRLFWTYSAIYLLCAASFLPAGIALLRRGSKNQGTVAPEE